MNSKAKALSFAPMTILAHLTGTDLGLITALFLAAAALVALGTRWVERIRK